MVATVNGWPSFVVSDWVKTTVVIFLSETRIGKFWYEYWVPLDDTRTFKVSTDVFDSHPSHRPTARIATPPKTQHTMVAIFAAGVNGVVVMQVGNVREANKKKCVRLR